MADGQKQPHDSAWLYSQLKGRHTEAVFPNLVAKEKSRGQWIVIGLLLFVVVMGAWGVAYETQVQLAPHSVGVCPAPAVIQSGGCFTSSTSTDAQGNVHTVLIPAGYICTKGAPPPCR